MTQNSHIMSHAPTTGVPGMLVDMPPRILRAWGTKDDKQVMLFLEEGYGHHTELVDIVEMDSWLHANHPQVFITGQDGKQQLDLTAIPSDVLVPCLAHLRAKRVDTAGVLYGYQLGVLLDTEHPFLAYAAARFTTEYGYTRGVARD